MIFFSKPLNVILLCIFIGYIGTSCNDEVPKSSKSEIESFKVLADDNPTLDQDHEGVIDIESHRIVMTVGVGVDLTSIVPEIMTLL